MMREILDDEAIEIRKQLLHRFHLLCIEHKINYSLGYGTLLGAVRHKGMIPWDDDIDVVMSRSEYEKLCTLFPCKDSTERYQLVNHRNHPEIKTKISYYIDFDTVTETAGVISLYHGIHIDVYPLDMVPRNGFLRCCLYAKRRILLSLIRIKDIHPSVKAGMSCLVKKCVSLIFSPFNYDKLLYKLEKMACSCNSDTPDPSDQVCCLVEMEKPKCFPYDVVKEYRLYEYENNEYYGFSDYNSPLNAWYGDYMTPPPENSRHRLSHKWVKNYYKDESEWENNLE